MELPAPTHRLLVQAIFQSLLLLCFFLLLLLLLFFFLLCFFFFSVCLLRQLVVETRLLLASFKVYYTNFSSMQISIALFHLKLGGLLLVLKQFAGHLVLTHALSFSIDEVHFINQQRLE